MAGGENGWVVVITHIKAQESEVVGPFVGYEAAELFKGELKLRRDPELRIQILKLRSVTEAEQKGSMSGAP